VEVARPAAAQAEPEDGRELAAVLGRAASMRASPMRRAIGALPFIPFAPSELASSFS
jgi:hypothetical protein